MYDIVYIYINKLHNMYIYIYVIYIYTENTHTHMTGDKINIYGTIIRLG